MSEPELGFECFSAKKSEQKRKGRPSSDDYEYVREILIKCKDKIVIDGKIKGPKDDVWLELKLKYNLNKTPKALYTCVSCNRWCIKQDLGLLDSRPDVNFQSNENERITESTDEDDCVDMFDVGLKPQLSEESPTTSFKLFLPKEKWIAIEPQEQIYIRKNPQNVNYKRSYMVLKPGIWADVLNDAIWDSIKWSCSWSFKGNYISSSDEAEFYLIARAKCACSNKVLITCPNPLPADPKKDGLFLDVKIWGKKDTHNNCDKKIRRRPFSGEKRIKLGDEMVEKGLKATRVRKEMASDSMDLLDPYPAHIFSNEVGRQIKKESLMKRRIANDPVRAMQLLKYSKNPIYMFAIHEIGIDPFYVHITTPHQLKLYNLYCKHNYSRLIVDATGKLVQKLERPCNNMSGHIFLYLGVILIPGQGEGLVPVVQMLSERHNSNALQYWLSEWVRMGAAIPNEVVLDDSAALISATCKALGNEPSTKSYIEKCFHYLQGNDLKPKLLIRLDVAHLTNLIRRWPEIVRLKKRTKEFYLRIVVLVAKAKNLQEVEILLQSIFTVALCETEGVSATSGNPTSCEERKKVLLNQIAGIPIEEDDRQLSEEDRDKEEILDQHEDELNNGPTDSLKSWLDSIEENVLLSIVDDGDRDNIMHAPDVAKKFKKLLLILPLWCSALPLKMKSPFSSGVGAYVETEIGQLKNNLLKNHHRVDDFVVDYLKICDGSLKIASTMSLVSSTKSTKANRPTSKACDDIKEKDYKLESRSISQQSSIIDRVELTHIHNEMSSVEGWKGLSLPCKKRKGYYWRNNPDFPALLSSSTSRVTRIGVLKNGMEPSLKAVTIGSTSVALTNTCSFDAACQIISTAYCDSFKYSQEISGNFDLTDSIIDVAAYIAVRGVTPQAYRKRASVLAKLFHPEKLTKGGFLKIDCAADCSSILRQMNIPPSLNEKYICSSPHCPSPTTTRKVSVISVIMSENEDESMQKLQEFIIGGDVDETSPCLLNIADTSDVPTDFYSADPELTKNGSLCMGMKKRETQVGPHILIEVISAEERLHNNSAEIGVQETIKCCLHQIPRQITYKSKTLYLRGVIGFTPPHRDTDIGHYRGYALRTDGSWEIYDDLRDKVIDVDGKVNVNVHLLLFTV